MYPLTYPQVLWITAETQAALMACIRLWNRRRALWPKLGTLVSAIAALVAALEQFGGSDVHWHH